MKLRESEAIENIRKSKKLLKLEQTPLNLGLWYIVAVKLFY